MKVSCSKRVRAQLALAAGLKAELLRLIRRKIARAPSADLAAKWQSLLLQVELSAPAYKLQTQLRAAAQLDRRCSMLTGPFYTSAQYPAPHDARGGVLFPVVQLELGPLASAIQEPLGDGLLQLWYDLAEARAMIRVIPLRAVDANEPTPFSWVAPADLDAAPMPGDWNRDPCGDRVHQIVGLVATGLECQAGFIEAHYLELAPEKPDWLGTLIQLFIEKAPYKRRSSSESVKLFGTFFGIQYSAADVGVPCLMSMGWYASGGAELFYRLSKGQAPQYSFWNCDR